MGFVSFVFLQYGLYWIFTLYLNIIGNVVGVNEEGITIEFESPYNGRMVDQISPEDFDSHVSEIADENGNVLLDESEEVGNDVVTPQDDVVPTNTGLEEDTTPVADQTATTEETSEPTALERIPKDEQGNPRNQGMPLMLKKLLSLWWKTKRRHWRRPRRKNCLQAFLPQIR